MAPSPCSRLASIQARHWLAGTTGAWTRTGATGCEARRAELEDDETDDLHVFFHLSIDVTKQIAGRSANILEQHLELKVEHGHQQLDALLDDDVPHPVALDEDAAVEDVVRPPAFQGVLPHPLESTARYSRQEIASSQQVREDKRGGPFRFHRGSTRRSRPPATQIRYRP